MTSPPSQQRVLRLYLRDGCKLCDEALAVIEAVRQDLADFAIELVDIESDPGLHAAYLERIPVAEVDGVEVFELFADRDALIEALSPTGTF